LAVSRNIRVKISSIVKFFIISPCPNFDGVQLFILYKANHVPKSKSFLFYGKLGKIWEF
jgi:hypothetical protein